MTEKKDKEKLIYINHKGELLIWLIIVLIFVASGVFFYYVKIRHSANVYKVFMPDIDGLIVGSPVRMMGIEVGHVIKIKPVHNDEVYIKFVLHDKNLKIPQGTSVTVEFSGMAGSKSLEIYPPDENKYIDNSLPLLQVNSPKRLHDAAGLLYEMFCELGKIISTSSRFSKNLQTIEMPKSQNSSGSAEEFLKYSNEVIDKSQERMEEFGRKINNVRK